MDWETVKKEMDFDKLLVNIGYEITDKICQKGLGNKIALKWQSRAGDVEEYTFDDLNRYSNRVANMLINLGIVKGDRACVYLDKIPELYFSAAGIWKAGAVFCPMFSSFGPSSIKDRLADSGANTIITQGNLLDNVLKVKDCLPKLRFVIVVSSRKGTDYPSEIGDTRGLTIISFENGIKYSNDKLIVFKSHADTYATIHYTSGTTGKPKGVLHTHGSIVGHYYTAKHALGLKNNDVFWCTADAAWVTGTSYGIIAPWLLGVTQVAADAGFRVQDVFRTIEKHEINVWYTSPTLLRMLMRDTNADFEKFDLSKLRYIASIGEALNPEVLRWSMKNIGIPVHDTWFQTETGCIMICNRQGIEIKEGSMGKPIPAITAGILDEQYMEAEEGQVGHLALKTGWPSMFKTYWGKDEVYMERFKNGWYVTGDKARKDKDGYFWFVARDDDVINTAGHLVSPFEVESALMEHEAVAEAAVVSLPDEVLGEKIKAFVVLKDGHESRDELVMDLKMHVRKGVAPFAAPQEIEFVEFIPKTESGKILRRHFI